MEPSSGSSRLPSQHTNIRAPPSRPSRSRRIIQRLKPSLETRRHINYIVRPAPVLYYDRLNIFAEIDAYIASREGHIPPEVPNRDPQSGGVSSPVGVATVTQPCIAAKKEVSPTTSASGVGSVEQSKWGRDNKKKDTYWLFPPRGINMDVPPRGYGDVAMVLPGSMGEKANGNHEDESLIDPADLEFDGPDDKRNPRNWPMWERIYNSVVPMIACFIVSFGASVYAAAVFAIQDQFGITLTQSLAGITLYVLGMGFGPFIAGPISETIGRRAVYFYTLPIAAAFSLGVGYATNFATILICRFFSAMFGSGVLAVGAGAVADIWDVHGDGAAVYTSCILLAMAFTGPSIGPLVGFQVIADNLHWRWTMFIVCIMIAAFMITVPFTRETYKKAILVAQARKDKKPLKKPPPKESLGLLFTVTLFRPVRMMFIEPIVCCISLYNGFCFAVFFAFFESLPYVLLGVYQPGERGLANSFLALSLGSVLAAATCAAFEWLVYQPRRQQRIDRGMTPIKPEERLYAALVGSILFPAGLFIWALTAKEDVPIIVPLIGCVLFAWGSVVTFIVTVIYIVHIYNTLLGASALGANSLVRYAMGACFPLFTVQMYDRLGIQNAGILLAAIAAALGPIPWTLFFYGARLRGRSVFIKEGKTESPASDEGVERV
ncbi:hypothetical protein DRE_01172 [Drechslerella stenobrocha 248]|uniref:Major facilitator superfamily (MFS) profile domain-containing protein n=1 Tax=Drechslerella stenobrocha 248 TaxID=1043628 RepID=W7HK27_9PEZI|nr:hypothetical protein DRE_01172 [Drechslerella stenobrocha 248]